MNEESLKLLDKYATELGTTTEYLWEILVSQAYVSGITSIMLAIASLIAFLIIPASYLVLERKADIDEEWWIVYTLLSMVIAVLSIAFLSISISNMVTALANPEYWALKEILNTIN